MQIDSVLHNFMTAVPGAWKFVLVLALDRLMWVSGDVQNCSASYMKSIIIAVIIVSFSCRVPETFVIVYKRVSILNRSRSQPQLISQFDADTAAKLHPLDLWEWIKHPADIAEIGLF